MNIAVYGTLKRGHPNHHFMKGSIYLGQFRTPPVFNMYALGAYPSVTLNGDTSILCEVYKVENLIDLKRIFKLEGYTGKKNDPNNFYDIHPLQSPFGTIWIFYMKKLDERFLNKKIASGNWNPFINQTIRNEAN